jgi:hypothetical protein
MGADMQTTSRAKFYSVHGLLLAAFAMRAACHDDAGNGGTPTGWKVDPRLAVDLKKLHL